MASVEQPAARDDVERDRDRAAARRRLRRYGFDFRQYAPASLRRRVWRRVHAEGLTTISALQDKRPARPRLHGAAAARPVDQRHRDVPRPELLHRVPREGRAAAADVSVHAHLGRRAARRARRSTRWRSCSRRRASYERARIYATDINESVLEQRAGGRLPARQDARVHQNYIKAGGQRAFSEYYVAKYDGAQFQRSLVENVGLRAAQPRLGPLVQRVQRDRLPQRDDLLRPRRCRTASTSSSTRA